MKKTGMAKSAAKKLMGMTQAAGTSIYGIAETPAPDRREQRKLDQAAGLVPFAIKLNGELVQTLQSLAREQGVELNELVAQLLAKGMLEK